MNDDNNTTQNAQACQGVGSQLATVCLPVSIHPYAVTGPAVVSCCGEMMLTPWCDRCRGKVNGCCEFTITQTIKIDIPVEFGATVKVGDTFVECGGVSGDIEEDCDCHYAEE